MSKRTNRALAAVGASIVLGAAAVGGLVSPAHAGGPGIHYIFGTTSTTCYRNLNTGIKLYRTNDYVVTGVHGCRLAGDGKRYFGDFVANPR